MHRLWHQVAKELELQWREYKLFGKTEEEAPRGGAVAEVTLCWNCRLSCSVTKSCPTHCDPRGLQHARLPCPSPSPGISSNSSIESVTLSNHLIHCRPLLLLPSSFPSIRVFPNESGLPIRWPKYWSFSISPSNEYSGLISFRIDWFDFAVQGTLKSLLQHHNSKT